jgi:hypothetical protein
MPVTQDDLFAEFGRPDAVPPAKALEYLGLAGTVDPSTVQAFGYYGADMAEAFMGNNSAPGRKLLGKTLVASISDDYYIAAYQITDEDAQQAFQGQNRFPDR